MNLKNIERRVLLCGTNYYAVVNKPSLAEPIHIGKNSYGWLFCFQEQDDKWGDYPISWHNYNDVKTWLSKHTCGENPSHVILDEYDRLMSYDEFIKMVEDKQKDPFNLNNPDNFLYSKNVDGYRFSDGDFS